MPNTPLTRRTGAALVKLIITGMVVQLLVVGYVFYQSYQGRRDLVDDQRAACDRGKRDRKANAKGWRIAEAARRVDGESDVADKYKSIAEGLKRRSRIDCHSAFPNASLLP